MKRTNTIIIGGGQAGLAASRCLTGRRVDHAVLERGRIGQSWSERWDSLRLLSPNWLTQLPGGVPATGSPDAFMGRDDVIEMLRGYASSFRAPVHEETSVRRVEPAGDDWRVTTSRGTWIAENVVIATGHCQRSYVPPFASELPQRVVQMTTSDYRNPSQLPAGGVLVVGASASGVQLAHELRASGREVFVAVGSHTRLPRRYRGRDILYWIERTGAFDRRLSDMPNPRAAMREPSLQLVGDGVPETLDLAVLAAEGVGLAGRLVGFDGAKAIFADDLAKTTVYAEAQLRKLLARIDRYIESRGIDAPSDDATIQPVPLAGAPRELDLDRAGIESVLWATGYRRDYSWLDAPVLDEEGEIIQHRGRTPARGIYVLGLQFMIRRSSSFLHGVGRDAEEIAEQIAPGARLRQMEAA
jgi:putative flavoprotein involved in K+ transport